MPTVTVEMSDEAFAGLTQLAGRRQQTPAEYLGGIAESMCGGNGYRLPGPPTDPFGRTPDEVAEDRARIMARSRPARPLPPGKTWIDVINELPRLDDGVDEDDSLGTAAGRAQVPAPSHPTEA